MLDRTMIVAHRSVSLAKYMISGDPKRKVILSRGDRQRALPQLYGSG
jgi:hypothetical protein